MKNGNSGGGLRRWARALRPLSWWVLLALILYTIRLHQRMMERTRISFTVKVQGRWPVEADTRLDGLPVVSGQRISLGNHTLMVASPKREPFQAKFFAWYGPQDFGEITLRRAAGVLHVRVDPPAPKVTVTGPEASVTLSDCSDTNLTLPTDEYSVRAEYAHWSEAKAATVYAGQSALTAFSARLGALRLACNKEGANYAVRAADGQDLASGDLPATVDGLPVGEYEVTATYHGRRIETNMAVTVGETNEIPIDFRLGSALIDSYPPDAGVYATNGTYVGQTPLELDYLPPHVVQFYLLLSGYERADGMLDVAAGETNSFQTNLISTRYVSAMGDARRYRDAGDYGAMLQSANAALDERPGDAAALALISVASARQKAEDERLTRLKRPREVFDDVCSKNSAAGLFQEYELKTSKSANEVERAIVQSLQSSPNAFRIMYDGSPAPDVYQAMARKEFSLGILGGSERMCLLVVGQTKDDETEVLFKVLEFEIQSTIQENGLAFHNLKELIPISPAMAAQNSMLAAQVQQGVQEATEKIQKGIGQAR